jgi:C4-dicarboxylate-specific signal transduction histidine kinase
LPPDQRPASLEDTLVKAADQIMRAGQIISHMRQFVGSGEPDKTICSLHELIREALELTSGGLKEANVAVTLKLDGRKDTILADRVQMEQVLVNLIRNAREAMSASPRRELTISTSDEQHMIRVAVADTGHGLSKKMQKKLFEPFATTKGSGMGVGLSVSQAIVEAHYGKIWGESDPRGGTVFTFVLPLAEGE